MIIVAGTKRSGTSMWMQILRDAGIPVFGQAFSGDWGNSIREANPEGFYESWFRNGINFTTNPHPQTGSYVHPARVRGHGVKVFIPGLVRSDLAYVERVIGTMREWREYDASVRRLYAMEYENKHRPAGRPMQVFVDPVLEWWSENHGLLADHITRLYPLHWVTYEETLSDPTRVVTEVIQWLRVGDAKAALETVKPSLSTQRGAELPVPEHVSAEHAAVFDELYRRVRERAAFDQPFIDVLNATNEALLPRIEAESKRVAEVRKQRQQKPTKERAPRSKAKR
uniref:Sulfotransferase domain-containing protein n=1 Tax=uncultured bacterium A1Q1_fos_479 TaxID=1256575 RepID=L7W128_9BACT|nr:hypothetical protein [uncultured bacterium A1Q1_fos_479]